MTHHKPLHCHALAAHSFRRILKLTRTIADLAASDQSHAAHVAEAIQYRPRRQG